MSWLHKSAHPWFLIVILAVLVTRLGGVHLHLCFDGQEPPATIHVANDAGHDEAHHVEQTHADQDVDLSDVLLVKKSSPFDLSLLFIVCAVTLLLLPARSFWPTDAFYRVFIHSIFLLRPPLRGPPL